MVDENETNAVDETVVTEAAMETPEAKKKRAPRRSPAEMAAAAALKSKGKTNGGTAKPAKPLSAPASAKATASDRAKPEATLNSGKGSATAAPALDEFADLLQLENENQSLRKALSEKLRAENADLRKRLGRV